jgi:hypothetical protein
MIKSGLDIVGQYIVDQLVKVLDEQGHRATGQLQDTMKYSVTESGGGFDITITGKDYAKFVDQGINKGKWVNPYALAEWVEQKGIATGEKEIKSAAFAIRRKIYDEGSPTRGSLQYSKSGKRDEFIKVMLDENAKTIFKMVADVFTKEVSVLIRETISKNRTTFETI